MRWPKQLVVFVFSDCLKICSVMIFYSCVGDEFNLCSVYLSATAEPLM